MNKWRRGRDSNPRNACALNGFRDRPVRPLRHLSAKGSRAFQSARTIHVRIASDKRVGTGNPGCFLEGRKAAQNMGREGSDCPANTHTRGRPRCMRQPQAARRLPIRRPPSRHTARRARHVERPGRRRRERLHMVLEGRVADARDSRASTMVTAPRCAGRERDRHAAPCRPISAGRGRGLTLRNCRPAAAGPGSKPVSHAPYRPGRRQTAVLPAESLDPATHLH